MWQRRSSSLVCDGTINGNLNHTETSKHWISYVKPSWIIHKLVLHRYVCWYFSQALKQRKTYCTTCLKTLQFNSYFLVVCLGEQINQVSWKTCTKSFTECTAISLLCLDKVLVHFADCPLEGSSVYSGFKLCWKSILELNRSAWKNQHLNQFHGNVE
jgi:hypothetical protein